MSNECRDYITLGVSLVVAAIDDFNNKPISRNQLHVWIEGEKPAIQKEEGYYVFVNLRRTEFVLNIEGGLYHRKEISIDSTKLSQYKGKVLKVRMFPNRSYPIPQNTTCIEGKAEKNSVVLAYSETYANPYKLLYSYQSGETQISIFHPEEADIEGKTMLIKNKEETQAEFFKAEEKQEDEKAVYSLGEPLSHAYKKIGTVIYPVYTMETDSNGEFYLPVNHIYDEKVEFTFCTRGENESEWNRKNVELRTGRVNKIDLR